MTIGQSNWLSPAEAARELGLTTQRIRQLMAEGQLGHQWTPLGRLVDADAVEALKAQRDQRNRDAPD